MIPRPQGNVCLNILREDWKPVLTITAVIYGLNFLFLVRPRPPAAPDPAARWRVAAPAVRALCGSGQLAERAMLRALPHPTPQSSCWLPCRAAGAQPG